MSKEKEAEREIVITRVFDAPRELVWNAWTDPKQVVHWWGPLGFTTTIHEMDVRPGGVWRQTMHGPDGANYPNKSVFVEVSKPERIVYALAGGKEGGPTANFQATWTFQEEGEGTRVTIRMVFDSVKEREFVVKEHGAIEGGEQTLGRLAEQLAKAPVVVERSFDASVETIWRAITELEQMKRWYMPYLLSFQPVVGFETQFNVHHNGKEFLHIWKVTEVVPGKKLAYSWEYAGYPGNSLVTFELSAEGAKTKLKLTHEGLGSFLPEINPDLARKNFAKGWTQIAESLEKFLEENEETIQKQLILQREFDAPRELVWKAWTDQKHVAQWWGPACFTNPVCEVDARPGGAILIHMHGPNGIVHPMKGTFQEVVPPERLSFLCGPLDEKGELIFEVLTKVELSEHQGKTTLNLHVRVMWSTPAGAQYLAGMDAGWTQSLERLAALVAKA
jgi:uncharacterized protein YndB with AHSA1/START domain